MKNNSGFALAVVMALLPLALAALFAGYALVSFIQTDLALKHGCRLHGNQGQEKVAPLLKDLLKLNTRSKSLKAKYVTAEKHLAIALVSSNYPAIAAARVELARLRVLRLVLEAEQRVLIGRAQAQMTEKYYAGKKQIYKNKPSNNFLTRVIVRQSPGAPPLFAVRPDSTDLAPTYSLKPLFAEAQALAHEWQFEIELNKPFRNFIPGHFSFKKSCAVTLEQKGNKWIPQITKGKFSLKSVW